MFATDFSSQQEMPMVTEEDTPSSIDMESGQAPDFYLYHGLFGP